MRDALKAFGGDPDRAGSIRANGVAAFVEAHIEQGPVLEAEGLPLGIVTAINGATRLEVGVDGVAGHAGATPMTLAPRRADRRGRNGAHDRGARPRAKPISSRPSGASTSGPARPTSFPATCSFRSTFARPTTRAEPRPLADLEARIDAIAAARGRAA